MLTILTHQITNKKPYVIVFKIDADNELIHAWYISGCILKQIFDYTISPDEMKELIQQHQGTFYDARLLNLKMNYTNTIFIAEFDYTTKEFTLRAKDE
jgi:hypothetical protein